MEKLKSDIGTKAAWKGFSSQTTYIASRMIDSNSNQEFHPEKIEDLLIKENGRILELVQIKNLGSDFSLSDLSPQKEDSFFKRALSAKSYNENLKIRVITYGDIGPEIQGLIDGDKMKIFTIEKKLINYGYNNEEIDWLFKALIIEHPEENELKKDVLTYFENTFKTMLFPETVYNLLIKYVSDLSRNSEHTSKKIWDEKVDNFVKDIMAVNGLHNQYGKTIIRLSDYQRDENFAKLSSEFISGVNAHPEHIRKSLDYIRSDWMDKIAVNLESKDIVLLKGASGQGKSTLAYRYLIDNYVEDCVFVIERVRSAEHAADLIAAIAGLTLSKKDNFIVYLDVTPYDTEWVWIIDEVNKRGISLKMIITTREEDFNRSAHILKLKNVNVISLIFSKTEAEYLYNQTEIHKFTNFEEAWKQFGEEGPLMEFMYLINTAKALKDKLNEQIQNIIINEYYADDWIDILEIISFAGKQNYRIDIKRFNENSDLKITKKMLLICQNEYLIKVSEDNKHIESLHLIRSELIYEIIRKDSMRNIENNICLILSSFEGYGQRMIVEYCNDCEDISFLMKSIEEQKGLKWNAYASVLSGILWFDAYNYYISNLKVIKEGNNIFNGNFLFFNGDATGLLDLKDVNLNDAIKSVKPDLYRRIAQVQKKMNPPQIEFKYTDLFFSKFINRMRECEVEASTALSNIGFLMFWAKLRGFELYITTDIDTEQRIENGELEELLDYLIGVQCQSLNSKTEIIRNEIIPIVFEKYHIIRATVKGNDIYAEFIAEILNDTENYEKNPYNTKVMQRVKVLRCIYYGEYTYHVKMLGAQIVPDIKIPDTQKNIPARNIISVWISQVNGWIQRLNDYDSKVDDWKAFYYEVETIRNTILDYTNILLDAINYFYDKKGNIKKFQSLEFNKETNYIVKLLKGTLSTPKCTNDKYGLSFNKEKMILPGSQDEPESSEYSNFLNLFNGYRNDFLQYVLNIQGLMKKRYERNELAEEERLLLINLVNAIDKIHDMQKSYNNLFGERFSYAKQRDEYERLILLASVTRYMYMNTSTVMKSIVYHEKNNISAIRSSVANFFNDNLRNSTVEENAFVIALNINEAESFLVSLYNNFHTNYPFMETLNVDSLFLKELPAKIVIYYVFDGDERIGGITVDLKNFIIMDCVDKFLNHVQPITQDKIQDLDIENYSLKGRAAIYYANMSSLSILYRHTTSVIKYLKALDDDVEIEEVVFNNWRFKAAEAHRDVFDNMKLYLEELKAIACNEEEKNVDTLINILNEFAGLSDDIVVEESYDILDENMKQILDVYSNIVDNVFYE